MKQFAANIAKRLAPRTLSNIRTISTLDEQFAEGPERFLSYERELAALRRDIDELRRDNRRVAELYDAVFEWAKTNAAAHGVAPTVDGPATVERIAKVIADEKKQPERQSSTPPRNGH